MLIEEKSLDHWIANFYGYGSWDAPIWFVSYEEGGGNLPGEVAEKFNYFIKTHSASQPALCDLRELYRHVTSDIDGPRADLFKTLYDYRFGPDASPHGIWKNLIAFAHGYRGKKVADVMKYQRNSFSVKDEALIQLYPLPSPHNHAWYYSWLDLPQASFLRTRTLYEEHVYQQRIRTLLENMKAHKPGVVVMYDMSNILKLKASVSEFFRGVKFKMIKAIPRLIPQHHLAEVNGTTLLITTQLPGLRHNRIETGFDWEELGKRVKLKV